FHAGKRRRSRRGSIEGQWRHVNAIRRRIDGFRGARRVRRIWRWMRRYAQFYLLLRIILRHENLAGTLSRTIAQRTKFTSHDFNIPALRNDQALSGKLLLDAHGARKRRNTELAFLIQPHSQVALSIADGCRSDDQ